MARVLAIGDIHGCRTALDAVLAAVNPAAGDQIITLGDYVDRGPDSRGVIARLMELHKSGRLVSLRGNHEQLMMDSLPGGWNLRFWHGNGGGSTLRSYGVAEASDIPLDHWRFVERTCVDYYETDTHIFVHAGVLADRPLDEQPIPVLRWEPFRDAGRHMSGKTVVCGHTRQMNGKPKSIGHAICIDTGVFDADGWLTCLDVATGHYWQANQSGDVREGDL